MYKMGAHIATVVWRKVRSLLKWSIILFLQFFLGLATFTTEGEKMMLKKLTCTIKTNNTEINFLAEFIPDKQVDPSSSQKKSLVSGFLELITWFPTLISFYELIQGYMPM